MIAQLALSVSLLSAATTTLALPAPSNPVYGGYLASWTSAAPGGPVADFNELTYFGANTTKEGIIIEGTPGSELKIFQEYAGSTKNKLLSIGGWAGSQYFSSKVKDDDSRKKFADAIAKAMKDGSGQVVFNGVDIDWIFPNGKPKTSDSDAKGEQDVNWNLGNWCNEYAAEDTQNLIAFIKVLRPAIKQAIGSEPTLTASGPMDGWNDSNGQKLADASGFIGADALDYITVMTHDVASNYRTMTGINAPLDDKAAPQDSAQQFSITKAVKYWTDARVPANKIVLALPAYGKIFRTTGADLAEANGSKAYQAKQMPLTAPDGTKEGNVQAGQYDVQKKDRCDTWRDFDATYTYSALFDKEAAGRAILKDDEGKGETAADGYEYIWDEPSSSPILFNKQEKLFITYDNPKSINAKSKFAASQGLLGIKLYHAGADYKGALMKAAKEGFASGATTTT